MTTREATDADDLTVLFPDLAGHTVNRAHVLVLEHQGQVRGVALLLHGGHSFAMVGAVRFVGESSRPEFAARALWRGVAEWGRAHGVTLMGHLALTDDCRRAMMRLGGTVRQPMGAMIEVPLCSTPSS